MTDIIHSSEKMQTITHLLIVEDDPKDLLAAAEAARAVGFTSLEARVSSESARLFLEKGLRGELSLPDAIVLDLDLGFDSGHELLRFCYSEQVLSNIPIVVWSKLGDEHRLVCEAFKVRAFVSKGQGITLLQEVLSKLGLPLGSRSRAGE